MKRNKRHIKNRKTTKKLNIKKLLLIVLFIATIFGIYPSLSKYKSATPEQIITILTKYHVNYQTSGGTILQPEKFNSYVSQTGLTLPIEGEVTRTSYDFLGWYDDNNFTGEAITKIESGETGDKLYFAAWNVSQYTLTVQCKDQNGNITTGLPDNYSIIKGKDNNGNDNIVSLSDSGTATIGKNELIAIRAPYSEDIVLGGFSLDNENISVTTRYEEGSQYVYYDFYMPRGDLTLTFNDEIEGYIDISKSSIIFEENVNVGSITQNGFWYKSTINGMTPVLQDENKGNFYVWNYSEPFYVTSNNKETKNQLIISSAMTVYFKDCNMVARDEFTNDFVGRKLKDIQLDIKNGSQLNTLLNNNKISSLADYGNVVIKSDNDNVVKGLKLYVQGENTIATIMQDSYRSTNRDIISIEGDNGTLNMAVMFQMASELTLRNITINEYENNFDYIMMLWNSTFKVYGCTINASSKNMYMPDIMPYFYKNDTRESIIKLNNIRAGYEIYIYNKTYLHIYNDIYVASGINIEGDSSLLVDGNIFAGIGGAYHTKVDTTGYVIVKGAFNGSDFIVNKGTIICNTLGTTRGGANDMQIKDGTIITNLFSNSILPTANTGAINTDNSSSIYAINLESYHSISANNDNLPFLSVFPTNTNAANVRNQTFSGGTVYIFGDYGIKMWNNKPIVDISADKRGKIVQSIIASILEDNDNHPDIKQEVIDGTSTSSMLNEEYLKDEVRKSNSKQTSFLLGRSDIDWAINFMGTKLYVSGNMDFRFKTNITAGEIICYGSIFSKHDITINGNDVVVQANEIGNQMNLTVKNENNLVRYSSITISSGTIIANKIGAVTPSVNDIENKSTIILNGNATIKPLEGDKVIFIQDEYINYLLSGMTNSSQNPTTLRFSGTINLNSSGKQIKLSDVTWNLLNGETLADEDLIFTNPINEDNDANWALGSETGQAVTGCSTSGLLTSSEYAPCMEQISLYAVKPSYTLNIKDGASYINSISYKSQIDGNLQTTTVNNVSNGDAYKVYVLDDERLVTLELNDETMTNKTVIWYYDGSGVLHNAMPEVASNNKTITFKMPLATTEIFVTNDLYLYLDKYEIIFTSYGFRTTWQSDNEDNVLFDDTCFKYLGNISIRQSTIKTDDSDTLSTAKYKVVTSTGSIVSIDGGSINADEYQTSNRIKFLKDFNNVNDTTRKITLNPIYQHIVSQTNINGVELIEGANVHLTIHGAIRTEFVEVPINSVLIMQGDDKTTANTYSSPTTTTNMFGTKKGGIGGDITFENLTYNQKDSAVGVQNVKNLKFNNCICNIISSYAIAQNVQNVEIIDSSINTTGYLFYDTLDVSIESSIITVNNIGYSVFYGIKNSVTLNGGTIVNMTNKENVEYCGLYNTPSTITINDNSILNVKDIFTAKAIKINGNGSLEISGTGNLLANDIYIDGENASLQATNIIVSGFYPSMSRPTSSSDSLGSISEFNNIATKYNENQHMFCNDGKFTLKNGTVNISNTLGGNLNFEITIDGGTMNAKQLGTTDKLYGVTKNSFINGEVYECSHISNSERQVVTINSGTANISNNGYLGGMNAQVNINGGIVALGENAIIGINETDTTTLVNSITAQGNTPNEIVDINITEGTIKGSNGYINTPYSTLDISSTTSNPSIKLKDILAENGTVNIKSTANHYDNPLGEGERVGTIINNNLIAQNIEISNEARVYANNAISKTNTSSQTGYLKIAENSYLYTNHYGTEGYGTSTITNNGTIVGNRKYTIQYIINDTYTDKATNTNPTSYTYGKQLTLKEPTRFGYTFNGWYDNEGNKITEITSTDTGDKILNASWTEKTVEFVVTISATDVGISNEQFATQVDKNLGSLNQSGDKFTYTKRVKIPYHELFNTSLLLSNYNLASYAAVAAKIDNTTLNPDGYILNLTSSGSTITREIMEYYLNNNSNPIKISVCEFVQSSNETSTINMDDKQEAS